MSGSDCHRPDTQVLDIGCVWRPGLVDLLPPGGEGREHVPHAARVANVLQHVQVVAVRCICSWLECDLRDEWYDNMGPSKQQKDIVLKTSIAAGAQCFLLGSKHLHGLGLDVSSLLQSEINLNCQLNSSWQPGRVLRQGQGGAS